VGYCRPGRRSASRSTASGIRCASTSWAPSPGQRARAARAHASGHMNPNPNPTLASISEIRCASTSWAPQPRSARAGRTRACQRAHEP